MKNAITLLLLLLLGLAACRQTSSPPPTPDPATPAGRGAALYTGKGRCHICHALEPGDVVVGPSLAGIAATAAERQSNLDAETYLRQSILQPDAYKPPGFEHLAMDPTLAEQLSSQEIDDLVAYMLTLN